MLKTALLATLLAVAPCLAFGQAAPTEERTGQVQAGLMYSFVHLDYSVANPNGFAGYADYDFLAHVGSEAEIRSANAQGISETTYSIGPRIIYDIRSFTPYAKVLFGRGSFDESAKGEGLPGQNGSFNVVSYGGGLDYSLNRHIVVRVVDYEYQKWLSFPPRGLQPNAVSFGVAYRFK